MTVRKRSPSVGRDPDGVERNLKAPIVKSRGRGKRKVAASPLPSPFAPWQPMQCSAYSSLPRATRSALGGMPITDSATFCGSKTSRHAPRFVPSFWTYRTSPTSSVVGTTRTTDVRAGGLSAKGVSSRTGVPSIGSSPSGRGRTNTSPVSLGKSSTGVPLFSVKYRATAGVLSSSSPSFPLCTGTRACSKSHLKLGMIDSGTTRRGSQ